MKLSYAVALLGLAFWSPEVAHTQNGSHSDLERASARVQALVQATRAVPGASPAVAIVIVGKGETPRVWVSGTADRKSGVQADTDTPFYIASMTKAYVGLLAAELDRRRILDLDSALGSYWPELHIPGVDTRALTLRDLLTHRLPIKNRVLGFRTAYVSEVAVAEYPRILASASEPKQPDFSYDNLGYLIYGALLERKTGRSWKSWLDTIILKPMRLTATSARTSDFPAVTAGHQWKGDGWHVIPAKADSIMHPAGGMVSSARDMAKWLQAHVEGQSSGLPAATYNAAHAPVAYPKTKRGTRICNGYALGWHRCRAHGLTLLEHGGGYTGFRSHMMILPDLKIGIAVLANSDSMTGGLTEDLLSEFLRSVSGSPEKGPSPAAFSAAYSAKVRKQAEERANRHVKDQSDPKWRGWLWKPTPAEVGNYIGTFRNEALGDLVVRQEGDMLVASLGEMMFPMIPAAPDLFAGMRNPMETRETLKFERRNGQPTVIVWDDDRFYRLP